jgi:hypothetical protein
MPQIRLTLEDSEARPDKFLELKSSGTSKVFFVAILVYLAISMASQ